MNCAARLAHLALDYLVRCDRERASFINAGWGRSVSLSTSEPFQSRCMPNAIMQLLPAHKRNQRSHHILPHYFYGNIASEIQKYGFSWTICQCRNKHGVWNCKYNKFHYFFNLWKHVVMLKKKFWYYQILFIGCDLWPFIDFLSWLKRGIVQQRRSVFTGTLTLPQSEIESNK